MSDRRQPWIARVQADPAGGWEVQAPTVGRWYDRPNEGAWVGPGAPMGRLQQLQERRALHLPQQNAGVIRGLIAPNRRIVDVEFGQVLFRLEPLGEAVAAGAHAGEGETAGAASGAVGADAGVVGVPAPTDGVYYARPAPGEPAFIEVGQTLQIGQPIGLVEVMKTFNQITYGGTGLPEQAVVVELMVEDGAEISVGQPLITVRKA